ncbi:beta-galactosidase [Myxococcota bacterium]|nr:beta-galactosidase [Myxococcota bacterium]MCZ7618208.1 beta-galactosidase [Myxococcota bacterium]
MTPRWIAAPCPLPTRWTPDVDPACVHPEHPRPQLVRPTWHCLNGVYEAAIRPAAEERPARFDERILVPFPVESSLSGLGRELTPADRLWYRRTFSVPEAPTGHSWRLHFGAVDWRAEVWLDGRALGDHEGGYDPFSFDAGRLGGEHELVVAVWDPSDGGPQPRGKQARHASRLVRSIFYTPVSGIWQTVWLEQVPETHLAALRLAPDRDTLEISARLAQARGDERLRAVASRDGRPVAEAVTESPDTPLRLVIPDARRWSPADPFLYDLTLEILRDGDVVDRATSYFGLRDVAIRRDARGLLRVFLNDEPIFLHGLLDQGYWPDGLYTAPSDAALRFDLEQTKRLGFNLVRKHVKIEPARWYWHCDRLGLLVFQDMPNGDRMTRGVPLGSLGPFDPTCWLGARGIRRTPASIACYERELDAMLGALANHPSIVLWVPFNEGWGQFAAARIAERVRALDPTRLVDAASGWCDPGNGDVRDVHVYYPGPRMPSRRDPTRAEVLGEWGGLGLTVDGHRWPRRPFAYRKFATSKQLQERTGVQLDALEELVRRGLAAAVWTQTTDVEGEVNGLFTYDRAVLKLDAAWLADRNRRLLEAASAGMRDG